MAVIIGNSGGLSISNISNILYPVGAIYISTSDTNPSSYLEGTWELFCPGKTLVCVDTSDTDFATVEKTGGNKNLQSHTHSISGTAASAGAHTHSVDINTTSAGSHQHDLVGADGANVTQNVTKNRVPGASGGSRFQHMIDAAGNHFHSVSGKTGSNGAHTHTLSGTSGSAGSGSSQNLQPYITCYMWKRTA